MAKDRIKTVTRRVQRELGGASYMWCRFFVERTIPRLDAQGLDGTDKFLPTLFELAKMEFALSSKKAKGRRNKS